MSSSLVDEIISWFEQERIRFADAARRIGISLSKSYWLWVGKRNENGSFSHEYQEISKSPLNDVIVASIMEVSLDSPHPSPANTLYTLYGKQCKHKTGKGSFEEKPEEWITHNLLEPACGEYLRELTSLDKPDIALAERVVSEMLEMITRSHYDRVTCLPIGGLKTAENSISYKNVTLRQLRAEELGILSPPPSHISLPVLKRGVQPLFFRFSDEHLALEIRESYPKDHEFNKGTLARRLVLAMQLLGFELSGSGHASQWTEPGQSLSYSGTTIPLPSHPRDRTEINCTVSDLERALLLAEKIPEGAVLSPRSLREVALHRFLLGAARDEEADAVIDFVIALESVFLSDVNEGEYAFKFRLFGAHYLAGSAAEREKIYNELKHLYHLRSKLVHGAKAPKREEVRKGAKQARGLAGRSLVKGLEEKWPSHESLTKLALGRG